MTLDFAEGVNRCLNDENFYKKLLKTFINDKNNYKAILNAYKEKNFIELFDNMHSMKGVSGNLALKDLYELSKEFCDSLRNNSEWAQIEKHFDEFIIKYEEAVTAIKEIIK